LPLEEFLLDKVADFFTRGNGGIREPEMRIAAIAISVVLALLGLVLYGVGIDNELHWMVPTLDQERSSSVDDHCK
jgi:hypothetical protein